MLNIMDCNISEIHMVKNIMLNIMGLQHLTQIHMVKNIMLNIMGL